MRMELVGQHAHPVRGERVNGEDDQARFARVVLPHLAEAYALARWLTGNGTDAEDVVQDACLRAFRGIAGFREGNARAWVLTIVRHTAYSWLGKNRPATLVVTDDVEGVEGAENVRGCRSADRDDRQGRCRTPPGRDPETAPAVPGDVGAARPARPRLPPDSQGDRRTHRNGDVATGAGAATADDDDRKG